MGRGPGKTQVAVLGFLRRHKDEQFGVAAIAEAVNSTEDAVRSSLNRLKANGVVMVGGRSVNDVHVWQIDPEYERQEASGAMRRALPRSEAKR